MDTRFAAVCCALTASIVVSSCNGGSADHAATPGAQAASAGAPIDSDAALIDSTVVDDSLIDLAAASQIAAMLPRHTQLVNNTLSRMQSEMIAAHMTADAAWNATADSVRQDLTQMGTMAPAVLVQAMPAHTARVNRAHRDAPHDDAGARAGPPQLGRSQLLLREGARERVRHIVGVGRQDLAVIHHRIGVVPGSLIRLGEQTDDEGIGLIGLQ